MRIGIHNTNDSKGTWTLRADLNEGERIWDKDGEEITNRFPIIGISSIREMLLSCIQYQEEPDGWIYDIDQ